MKNGQGRSLRRMPWWERLVMLAGICLLCFLAIYLALREDEPAVAESVPHLYPVAFEVRGIEAINQGYLVHLTLRNQGSSVLRGVHVEGRLGDGPRPLERSVGHLEILPPGSSRRIAIFFSQDPRQHPLQLLASETPTEPASLPTAR